MHRCARAARVALATAFLALVAAPLLAQPVQRNFPPNALRGKLLVTQPPEVLMNGQPGRLAPGARIRAENNLIVVSGALVGRTITVHYTLDAAGQLDDVWLLSVAELDNTPWPSTPEQAQKWRFDPIGQTWSRW